MPAGPPPSPWLPRACCACEFEVRLPEVTPITTTIRVATADDVAILVPLMEAAIEELQRDYLDDAQIESSKAIMGPLRNVIGVTCPARGTERPDMTRALDSLGVAPNAGRAMRRHPRCSRSSAARRSISVRLAGARSR
jgi:hypothetical protein